MFRSAYRLFSGAALSILLLAPGMSPYPTRVSAAGSTYTVNSTADLPDSDVGIPSCLASNGLCTLRAAIQQANFTAGADTILLPAGVYVLDRPGQDDAAVLGDLDITDDLTLQGAGSGVTIVDGNGAVTGDRVFQILSSAKKVTLSGLTMRHGKRTATFDEGGGLVWDGGGSQFSLSDVVIENNAGYYGGGLYLNYSAQADSVTLDHLVVQANTAATAAAGGLGVILGDFAAFTLKNSQITGNMAYQGGGLFLQNQTANDFLSVVITNTSIFGNTATLSAGFENRAGSTAVPVILQNSTVSQNHASGYGGGIGNYGTLTITTTTLDANSAVTRGGGIYDYEGGILNILQSTLSRNTSTTGGGIYSEFFIHNAAGMVLTNSTISGNAASQDGAGIYADGGQIGLYNATVANNQVLVPAGTDYIGLGGGVYFMPRVGFTVQNALIADNTHRYGTAPAEPDDCYGLINSKGYSLIETLTTNCTIFSLASGNITGLDPRLGPLQGSPGKTQVQRPMPGSPAIDAGETPDCTDANGAAISIDQVGVARPQGGGCDIGAVENLPVDEFLPYVQ